VQTTAHALMVRPARFMANPQTMGSNAFQRRLPAGLDAQAAAAAEFDDYVTALRDAGVQVLVVQDEPEPHTPDSIFPNNWVSFHADGTVLLYPMEAPNRRQERKAGVLRAVAEAFDVTRTLDLSGLEEGGRFLEGTGSMVLDRAHKLAYLCRSSRSHPRAVRAFADLMGYRPVWFDATDAAGRPIYHTNVMMALGQRLAIVCLEALPEAKDRAALLGHLRDTGKAVLPISRDQMGRFAGNVIELAGRGGDPVFGLSRQAWQSLDPAQQNRLRDHGTPIIAPLDTIEACGGGGARCMVAEIHLPPKTRDRILRAG
jgi:hypothetical protein